MYVARNSNRWITFPPLGDWAVGAIRFAIPLREIPSDFWEKISYAVELIQMCASAKNTT